MARLELCLPHTSIPIFVGNGCLNTVGQTVVDILGGAAAGIVATDRNVARTVLPRVTRSLKRAGWQISTIVLQPGETTKDIRNAVRLYRDLIRHRAERRTPVFAVGGGVIGDLAGFVASTYMRGVPLIHIPTTLLAQVDSSIGGKTAVDMPEGKNLVGTFYHPRAVFSDPSVLSTLPRHEWITGLAEIVKCAVIRDETFFATLETQRVLLLARDPAMLETTIRKCAEIKIRIVEQDEKESGPRELLNYGHTLGHAIEASQSFRGRTHGEAVALGMTGEAWIAHRLGMINPAVLQRQTHLLAAFGLPVMDRALRIPQILKVMKHDKKIREGKFRFTLPERIGSAAVGIEVAEPLIRQALQELKV